MKDARNTEKVPLLLETLDIHLMRRRSVFNAQFLTLSFCFVSKQRGRRNEGSRGCEENFYSICNINRMRFSSSAFFVRVLSPRPLSAFLIITIFSVIRRIFHSWSVQCTYLISVSVNCTLFVARCTLHVARCTLHVARCTLHVARCTLHVARIGKAFTELCLCSTYPS